MKKRTIPAELVYALSLLILSLSVAMLTAADFGVSMIVAPSYILSLRFPTLTIGQWEYVLQTVLLVIFCLLMRQIKWTYFTAFLTGVIYGTLLDLWRAVIPLFDPAVTPPGSMAMPVRIVLFLLGVPMTSLAVALVFRVYLYPQMCDFFVKGVAIRFSLDQTKTKRIFDAACLAISCGMTLVLFGEFRGIGVGTVIITLVNGLLIGRFGGAFDRVFTVEPIFKRFSRCFALEGSR